MFVSNDTFVGALHLLFEDDINIGSGALFEAFGIGHHAEEFLI